MQNVDILLTRSQEVLKDKMKAFLEGPERFFLLIGKPGVGKTTMTEIVLEEFIKADQARGDSSGSDINVAGITMAHQAKNVLGEFIPNVFTFAHAYGMKPQYDEFTGKKRFVRDPYSDIMPIGLKDIPVFVHDEVSMYTEEMLELIMENTSMFSKTIFIGDSAQLPPITENGDLEFSPVFDMEFPESCRHELTERVRQAEGNPILDLSDIIREEIFGEQNIPRVIKAIKEDGVSGGVGFQPLSYDDLIYHIDREDVMETRVLAYRNNTMAWLNNRIRNHILDNPKSRLVQNDIVTMNDTFRYGGKDDVSSFTLYNSETFRLGNTKTYVQKYNCAGTYYDFDAHVAQLEGPDNKIKAFFAPTHSGLHKFNKALNEVAGKCKRKGSGVKWDEFWKMKEIFCDFSYGFANSIHKAQGSTFKDIYLDVNDIFLTKPTTDRQKLQALYTGITRAKENVYFLKSR